MTPVSVNDTARVTTRRRVPASSAMRAARTATLGIGLVLVLAACATVEKTAARDPINSSEHAIFNIEVGVLQEGPENQPAQDVTLTDDLPDGQLWAVTGDAGALAGCEVDEGTLAASSGTLTCDFEEIPYDETVALAITAVTDGTDCGEIENEAQVSQILPDIGGGEQLRTTSSSDTITVNCPDLVLDKTAQVEGNEDGSIDVGGTYTYELSVVNNGPGTAYNVVLSDNLPDGLVVNTSNLVIEGGHDNPDAGCTVDDTTNTFTCNIGTLDAEVPNQQPAGTVDLTIEVTTTLASCGEITNQATASSVNEAADTMDDNSAEAPVTVNCPDISVLKTADDDSVVAGDDVSYTIDVTAGGTVTSSEAALFDDLPDDQSWSIEGDTEDCTVDTGTLAASSGALTCEFGELEPDATRSLTVTATTDEDECGTITNTAEVSATEDQTTDNNFSTATIQVGDCAGSPPPAGTVTPTPKPTGTATPRAGALPNTADQDGGTPSQIAIVVTAAILVGSVGTLAVMNRSTRRARKAHDV